MVSEIGLEWTTTGCPAQQEYYTSSSTHTSPPTDPLCRFCLLGTTKSTTRNDTAASAIAGRLNARLRLRADGLNVGVAVDQWCVIIGSGDCIWFGRWRWRRRCGRLIAVVVVVTAVARRGVSCGGSSGCGCWGRGRRWVWLGTGWGRIVGESQRQFKVTQNVGFFGFY